jgi:peroxiredoxin Q/BCP
MPRMLIGLAATLALATPAWADLDVGDNAPQITAEGFLGGVPFHLDLAEALAEGPVVLYFFPAAFTSGCNIEAALFAQSAAAFEAAGATLVGLTAGNTDRLGEFSQAHCASAFPVAAASSETVSDYDVALALRPGWSQRTSYVIGTDAKIAFVWTDMNPDEHVDQTLQAVQAMQAAVD